MTAKTKKSVDVLKRIVAGDTSAFSELDENDVTNEKVNNYNILGVYSGVVGSTKLQELALGKCWHIDTLFDLIKNYVSGEMPYHEPLAPHEYYEKYLEDISGVMIIRDVNGDAVHDCQLV